MSDLTAIGPLQGGDVGLVAGVGGEATGRALAQPGVDGAGTFDGVAVGVDEDVSSRSPPSIAREPGRSKRAIALGPHVHPPAPGPKADHIQ